MLAGAVPYADARLESEASRRAIHVESEAADACGLGHDHVFCQLCRALQLRAASPADAEEALAVAVVLRTAVDDPGAAPSAEHRFHPVGSRAPPRV